MSLYGTFVEDKNRGFNGECAHFSFNKCPIYTHDGASANFSTNSQETDNSVAIIGMMVDKDGLDNRQIRAEICRKEGRTQV